MSKAHPTTPLDLTATHASATAGGLSPYALSVLASAGAAYRAREFARKKQHIRLVQAAYRMAHGHAPRQPPKYATAKEAQAAYYEANRERILAQKKEHTEANRDRINARERELRKSNPERLERERAYRAANHAKVKQWKKDWENRQRASQNKVKFAEVPPYPVPAAPCAT